MKDFFKYDLSPYTIFQTPTLWRTHRNYNYIVAKDNKALVFDPGEFEPIQRTLTDNNLEVDTIYLTHHHPDHSGATLDLKKQWSCEVWGFDKDASRLPGLTKTFSDGQKLTVLDLEFEVIHLPGHTHGLCAFYCAEKNWLFSNDLLFSIGCGRVFEGTPQQMFQSLSKVRELPPETQIFASHEYTASNLAFALSIFEDDSNLNEIKPGIQEKQDNELPTVPVSLQFEKKNNPFLRWDDPYIRKKLAMQSNQDWEVFAEIRRLKDLA